MQSVTKEHAGRNKSLAKKGGGTVGKESASRINLPPHLAFKTILDKGGWEGIKSIQGVRSLKMSHHWDISSGHYFSGFSPLSNALGSDWSVHAKEINHRNI